MIIPPVYRLTDDIVSLLTSIEANKSVIDSLQIPVEIEENIRRQSTLKSSLFSARIEGNDLSLDDVSMRPSKDQKKAEVYNILKSLGYLRKNEKKDFTYSELLKLHEIAMKGLLADAGKLRREPSATFNSAGIAIYMHPPFSQVEKLTKKLIKFIHSDKGKFIPIKAALAHYSFEKIHPFLDGNGRIGRLLMQKVLMHGGYGMKGLLAIEEYIDSHRSEYYRALEEPEKDCTDYLLFMLESIDEASKKARAQIIDKQAATVEDYLLPRRAEIYNIIRDQKLVNFDRIRRRFSNVNERTLRYDLKKLQDKELIRKRGTTNGVYYEVI